ncbi:MAG: intermembrane phospholipid transport protein YdbH family protein [Terriglobia bacterium]
MAVDGSLRWTGAALSTNLIVRLKDLAFATSAAHVRQLNGAIKVVQLWPPATAPGQALAATIEIPGLPAAGLRLNGQLTATQVLKLERLEIKLAGGEITTLPFAIDPERPRLETILQVNQIDLAELTKLLGIDGLSGTGQLGGRIPIGLEDRIVTVNAGRLAANGPGLLRYQPRTLPTEIAAAGESVELVLRALSDFHYESLTLDLDKSGSGEGAVLLHLKGNNPAVLSGQAFNFNIRLESNFDRLVDYALLSVRSMGELLRRAARRDVH